MAVSAGATRTMVVLCTDEAGNSEAVARVIESIAPRLEVVQPGCCAVPTRGPSRYFGGDEALANHTLSLLGGAAQIGIADGLFAATQAARTTSPGSARVIHPEQSAKFLAPLSVRTLAQPELVDVLRRLGLRRLGDLAELPAAKVLGRFGVEGLQAQHLARGCDPHPFVPHAPQPKLQAALELDPPLERVEAAAFMVRGLAEDLHRQLSERGSSCTRVLIGAETEHGERLERVWRTEGSFGPGAMTDRLRWQLDGWLQSSERPTAGITRLWLIPDEVVPAGGSQLSFDQDMDAISAAERAGRALARVQGLIGQDAVRVPEWQGGRGLGERVRLVPLDAPDLTEPRPAAQPEWVDQPWPGAIPPKAAAIVHAEPAPVKLVDAAGAPLTVSGRGELSAPPAQLNGEEVVAWAGPWPCDERWWDITSHRRRARLQVVTRYAAHLVALEDRRWNLEATYD